MSIFFTKKFNQISSGTSLSSANLPGVYFLIALFASTRLALASLQIRPDITHLYNHWQHLDVDLLKNDYFQSIIFLHSQPPLWNAILGALWKAADGSEQQFLFLFTCFSLAMSLGIALLIFLTLTRLRVSRMAGLTSASIYILASSAYYYENYIFYPLFTAFLAVSFFSSLAYAFSSKRRITRLSLSVFSCILLLLLSLTWTLFHPIFVIATSWIILWRASKTRVIGEGNLNLITSQTVILTIGIVLTTAIFAVPIKNKLLFDNFSSGSWVGMNLSQVTSTPESKGCNFSPLNNEEIFASKKLTSFTELSDHASIKNLQKRSGGRNMNHIGFIERSNSCMPEAVVSILRDVPSFAKGRARAFIRSTLKLSDSYKPYPKGMEPGSTGKLIADARNSIYFTFSITNRAGRPSTLSRAALLIPLGILSGAGILVFWPTVRAVLPRGALEPITASLWLMIWLYIIGHLFNGGEQERMRFTIEPLFIMWTSLMTYYIYIAIKRDGNFNSQKQP